MKTKRYLEINGLNVVLEFEACRWQGVRNAVIDLEKIIDAEKYEISIKSPGRDDLGVYAEKPASVVAQDCGPLAGTDYRLYDKKGNVLEKIV
jgi:hypothetical protein